MIVELTLDDVLRRFNDRVAELFVELAQSHVGFGRGALDDAEGAHDRCRLPLPTNLEIAEAALGLRAPVAVGGDFDGSERVGFRAGFGHGVFGPVHRSRIPRIASFVAHTARFVERIMRCGLWFRRPHARRSRRCCFKFAVILECARKRAVRESQIKLPYGSKYLTPVDECCAGSPAIDAARRARPRMTGESSL